METFSSENVYFYYVGIIKMKSRLYNASVFMTYSFLLCDNRNRGRQLRNS